MRTNMDTDVINAKRYWGCDITLVFPPGKNNITSKDLVTARSFFLCNLASSNKRKEKHNYLLYNGIEKQTTGTKEVKESLGILIY